MKSENEKLLIESLRIKQNLLLVQVITTTENFEKRYEGSISYFFRCLKNGLYSLGGVSNREYFKGISGVYFSLEEGEEFEIIIIIDTSIKVLNELQIKSRIKKLLGYDAKINFGTYAEFEYRIKEMIGIKRKSQVFGDYYFDKKKISKNGKN